MGTFLAVRALQEEGVPKKEIARRLDIDPRTVRKYVARIAEGATEPHRVVLASKLDPFAAAIRAKAEQGLSAVQIYQDLCAEKSAFSASYETVKRLVRRLRPPEVEAYCRLHFRPGEEAQLDFGDVGRLLVAGRLRRTYLFVMTLCFSRYAYYELVLDQRVPTFLGAIGRAFEFFGGVPHRIKPDNLKAAVLLDELGERYYQEDFFRFCRHYGTLPDAARPLTPTDKGRVERDIRYAKGNFFRGRQFPSFESAAEQLAAWRDAIANVRLHGTTRRRPVDLFEEERASLRTLAAERYEVAELGRYLVRKDCHVHVDDNYYSVPHPFVGEKVLVRLGEREVVIAAQGRELARHARARGKGESVTDPSHYPPTKRVANHEIHRQRVLAVRSAGPRSAEYLSGLRSGPLVFGPQVARLMRAVARYGEVAFEHACERALFFGATQGARTIERILERGLHDHPLPVAFPSAPSREGRFDFGRPLAEYGTLLATQEVA